MAPLLFVNALLAFAVEMVALAGCGLWGWSLFASPRRAAVAALVAAALFAALWGVFAAPKSSRRLRRPWLAPFKAAMFAGGAVALAAAGTPAAGLGLGLAGALQIGLALALDAL